MIVYISLQIREPVYFRHVEGGGFERVTVIDRRLPEGQAEYPRCDATTEGVRILKRGCYAKLLPWSTITELDFTKELGIEAQPSAASAPPNNPKR